MKNHYLHSYIPHPFPSWDDQAVRPFLDLFRNHSSPANCWESGFIIMFPPSLSLRHIQRGTQSLLGASAAHRIQGFPPLIALGTRRAVPQRGAAGRYTGPKCSPALCNLFQGQEVSVCPVNQAKVAATLRRSFQLVHAQIPTPALFNLQAQIKETPRK